MSDQPIPPRSARLGVIKPLRLRDFRLLWTGMFVSMVGDGIYYVSMALQVIELRNTPSALAVVGIAWSLPQVLLLLLSGVLADRIDRRRLMIAGDLVRLVAISTIGVLSISDVLTIPILIALVFVFGVGQALFQPAFSSIVPDIVPSDLLVEANSLDQFVRPLALMLLGPMLGGFLVGVFDPGVAFLIDGATFAFSALMIARMRARPPVDRSEEAASVWADALAGLAYVRRTRWLLITMTASILSLFAVWGPWEALVPFIVKNELGSSDVELGLVYAAGGAGAVTVALTFGQRGRLPRRAMTALYLTWAVGMFATAGFGVVTELWHAMLVAAVAEASITALVVIWITVIQRLVPSNLLGRVMSLDWMITIAGVPLSFAVVGPMASAIGADATMLLAGLVGGGVTLVFMFVPGSRTPERDGSLERASAADDPTGSADDVPIGG